MQPSQLFEGIRHCIFSAGATVSRAMAPLAAKAGATVIDNSSAWRRHKDVPLVVSEVNPAALQSIPLGIVANPNCTTMIAMPVLKPLHDEAGLEKMVVSTYQAVSGAGYAGLRELNDQISSQHKAVQASDLKVFPEPIGYNVIPFRGNKVERDTDEEQKLLYESRKILEIAELAVSATCVGVPVKIGHSLSIEASFKKAMLPQTAEDLLRSAEGVELSDIPTPLKAAGGNVSLVGRIRQSGVFGAHGLSLFISGDNLRKGAALNAVQIAELLIKKIK